MSSLPERTPSLSRTPSPPGIPSPSRTPSPPGTLSPSRTPLPPRTPSSPGTPPSDPSSPDAWRFEDTYGDHEWVELYRPQGYHPVNIGDTFHDGRYRAIRKLGEGSFSTVWLVSLYISDSKSSGPKYAAMKIISARTSAASTEITILKHLSTSPEDPGSQHILNLLDSFQHEGPNGMHLCLVFELMAAMEEQDLKQNEAKTAVPVNRVDGKADKWAPLNVYLRETLHEYAKLGADLCIKLSDFGVAFFDSDPPASATTPIGLRAPELILKRDFNNKIDAWSFGCLMYEVLASEPLFALMGTGSDEDIADDDHFVQLHEIIRPLPESIMRDWKGASKWYGPDGECLSPHGSSKPYSTLEERFAKRKHPDIGDDEAATICQIIREALAYDPAERPTVEDLLGHAWFSE
ncbi:kinase-like domain-containing protein [Boeremia exigua]|uniref:kinase-like domain-containing protein n=1 Tax=Boeremia exigua TaxID=749465 RepID=UPI001E8E3F8B|nr:kinase-like domain-containing protein [Boeremia exigua]KAH6637562.1 kinase-like domain-containing protein [Boeremia exigua]